jgi:hypothetical protein
MHAISEYDAELEVRELGQVEPDVPAGDQLANRGLLVGVVRRCWTRGGGG